MTEQKGRGLVVVHIDGLGAASLEQALREGDMPFIKSLILLHFNLFKPCFALNLKEISYILM